MEINTKHIAERPVGPGAQRFDAEGQLTGII